jgi:hypothetical protein
MRTTIDLPDPLYQRARALARKRGVPLRALVEEGLRVVLRAPRGRYRMPDLTFHGDGLVPGLAETDWDRIRDLAYEGRGA